LKLFAIRLLHEHRTTNTPSKLLKASNRQGEEMKRSMTTPFFPMSEGDRDGFNRRRAISGIEVPKGTGRFASTANSSIICF
jgi:hypothetical protein